MKNGSTTLVATIAVVCFMVSGLAWSFEVESPPDPAEFVVENLSIYPKSVALGEEVTISVDVTNVGGQSGSHEVELKIDGEFYDNHIVALDPGQSTTVSFTVSKNEIGAHTISIDGISGNFEVACEIAVPLLGDVNGDGEVKMGDAMLIAKWCVGLPVPYPIGEPIVFPVEWVWTNMDVYSVDEDVTIFFKNRAEEPLTFPCWRIERYEDGIWKSVEILPPGTFWISTEIMPKETKYWTWDQEEYFGTMENFFGIQAAPGRYRAVWSPRDLETGEPVGEFKSEFRVEARPGDVWPVPQTLTTLVGMSYSDEMHANTDCQNLGAFNLTITYDPNLIRPHTVEWPYGWTIAVNFDHAAEGWITIGGFTAANPMHGNDVKLMTIGWNCKGPGTTVLGLTVTELTDYDTGGVVGTPYGIDGVRTQVFYVPFTD